MQTKLFALSLLLITSFNVYSQQKSKEQSDVEYLLHYDCKYEPGNILVIQKKGKTLDYKNSWKATNAGFVIRMEAIYDLKFADGKRYRSGVIKNITRDSITISSTMNESCAQYEGIEYKLITYPITDIKLARFINDRSLGIYARMKITGKYQLLVKEVDKAKFCPAVLTFSKRNNEVKVCHYYLTSQGYNLLYETNGRIDFMEYNISYR